MTRLSALPSVLVYIQDHPGSTAVEIGRALGISQSRMAQVLAQLAHDRVYGVGYEPTRYYGSLAAVREAA